jgi:hypothetical protein
VIIKKTKREEPAQLAQNNQPTLAQKNQSFSLYGRRRVFFIQIPQVGVLARILSIN